MISFFLDSTFHAQISKQRAKFSSSLFVNIEAGGQQVQRAADETQPSRHLLWGLMCLAMQYKKLSTSELLCEPLFKSIHLLCRAVPGGSSNIIKYPFPALTLLNVHIQPVSSAAVGLSLLDHFKKLPRFLVFILPTIETPGFILV